MAGGAWGEADYVGGGERRGPEEEASDVRVHVVGLDGLLLGFCGIPEVIHDFRSPLFGGRKGVQRKLNRSQICSVQAHGPAATTQIATG
jgi:hypothetical protein